MLIDYDAAFKICSDIFLGRPWPVAFGTGIGLGMGYSNCQNDFQQPNILHGKRIKVHVYYMLLTLIFHNISKRRLTLQTYMYDALILMTYKMLKIYQCKISGLTTHSKNRVT